MADTVATRSTEGTMPSLSQRVSEGMDVAIRVAMVQGGRAEARGGADPLEGLGMPDDCIPEELPALRSMILAFSSQMKSCSKLLEVLRKQYEEVKKAADRERELAGVLSEVDASLEVTGKEDEATKACSRACLEAGQTRSSKVEECEKKVIHVLESLSHVAMVDAERSVKAYEDARVKYALAKHAVKRAHQKHRVRPALYMHEKSTRDDFEVAADVCKSKLAMCLSKTAVDLSTALRSHVECFAAMGTSAGHLYNQCKLLMPPMVEASIDRAEYILSMNRPTTAKALKDSEAPPTSVLEQEVLD